MHALSRLEGILMAFSLSLLLISPGKEGFVLNINASWIVDANGNKVLNKEQGKE